MPHDVFVSHSSDDKPTADAICAALENARARCWIAPRDIVPGKNWSESIIDAIAECRLMVVVFSSHSNDSAQVMREVERAVHKGIPIIPFRIEDVPPSKSLEFFLSTPHWLDALTPPLQAHIDKLTGTVQSLLAENRDDQAAHIRNIRPDTHQVPLPIQSAVSQIAPDEWFTSNTPGVWTRLWKYLTRE
jgi:hypothetical protein